MEISILYTAVLVLIVLSAVLFVTVTMLNSSRKKFEAKKAKTEAIAKLQSVEKGEVAKDESPNFIPSISK